jgi:hypothetical protein
MVSHTQYLSAGSFFEKKRTAQHCILNTELLNFKYKKTGHVVH